MENNIKIEERLSGKYILTGQKYKGQEIVIKIGSTINQETFFLESITTCTAFYKKCKVTWTLEYNDDLYIKLKTSEDKFSSHMYKLDATKCINELVHMVQNNCTLDACKEIQKGIYECNNQLFKTAYKNDYIVHSESIIEGLVAVLDDDKILGYGSRFILRGDKLTVCEYVGQTITKDMVLTFKTVDELIQLNFQQRSSINKFEEKLYSKGSAGVGYLEYEVSVSQISNSLDIPTFTRLKAPYTFSDKASMKNDVIALNTAEEIQAYKLALRGKVELIDVNKYMLNEYLI